MPPAEPTRPVISRTEALRLVLISGFAYQYADDHGWMRGRYTDEHLRAADAAAEAALGRDTLEALSALCTAEHWSSDDMMLAAATVNGPATLLARLDAPADRSGHSLRDVAQAINDHGVHAEVVMTGGNCHSVRIPTGYGEILINDASGPLSSGDEPVEGIVATGYLTVDDDLVPWRCTELDPTGERGDGAIYESPDTTMRDFDQAIETIVDTAKQALHQGGQPEIRPRLSPAVAAALRNVAAALSRAAQAWQDDDQAAWDTTSTQVGSALSMSLDEAAHEVAAFVAEAT